MAELEDEEEFEGEISDLDPEEVALLNQYGQSDLDMEEGMSEDQMSEQEGGSSSTVAATSRSTRDALQTMRHLEEQRARQRLGRSVSVEEIRNAIASRRKFRNKGQRGRRRVDELPPHLVPIMSNATMCYMSKQFSEAKKLLNEIIRNSPRVSSSYRLLGLIAEDENDRNRALQYYYIAASVNDTDLDAWRHVGQMSRELGQIDQAINCYQRIIRSIRNDPEALFNLAEIFADKDPSKSISYYLKLLEQTPNNLQLITPLARLYSQRGEEQHAARLFEEVIARNDPNNPYTLEHVNYLAELYQSMGQHHKTIELIEAEQRKANGEQLPLDLIVKATVAYIHVGLGHTNPAQAGLAVLEANSAQIETVGDLHLNIADAYITVEDFPRALAVLTRLMQAEEFDEPFVWLRVSSCHLRMKNIDAAEQFATDALNAGGDSEVAESILATVHQIRATSTNGEFVLPSYVNHLTSRRTVLTSSPNKRPRLDLGQIFETEDEAFAKLRDRNGNSGVVDTNINGSNSSSSNNSTHPDRFVSSSSASGPSFSSQRRRVDTPKSRSFRTKHTPAFMPPAANKGSASTGTSSTSSTKIGWLQLATNARRCLTDATILIASQSIDIDALYDIYHELWGIFITNVDKNAREENGASDVHNGLKIDEWLEVIIRFASVLFMKGETESSVNLLNEALTYNMFARNDSKAATIHMALLVIDLSSSTITNSTVEKARWMCMHNPNSHVGYNIFWAAFSCGVERVRAAQASHHTKFMVRQAQRNKNNVAAQMSAGYQYMIHRSIPPSLVLFVNGWQADPMLAATNLHLGVTILQQSMQRISPNRHIQVAQGIGLIMRYHMCRDGNQEANYNVGRAFQSIGMHQLALPFYERALQQQPFPPQDNITEDQQEDVSRFDLKREIGWNMSLIYFAAGNSMLAAHTLAKYCTIE